MFKQNRVAVLKENSARVLDSFRQALVNYTDINDKINIEVSSISNKLKDLEREKAELETIHAGNTNYINKIENFLN